MAKAFQLTETTRQLMREGIRRQHPNLTESGIEDIYVDRLLRDTRFENDESEWKMGAINDPLVCRLSPNTAK